MNSGTNLITASARIHFGLFSVNSDASTLFGGMGLMIKSPSTIVSCRADSELRILGQRADIVGSIVNRWFLAFGHLAPAIKHASELPVQIELLEAATSHSGLGSGTQLAFSVATQLFNAFDIPLPTVNEIANALNRGRRSAIGSHGFFRGGCLVDRGISDRDSIAPLDLRVDFPVGWPVILIRPVKNEGLHGRAEKLAFAQIIPDSDSNRTRLTSLCTDLIIPAIEDVNYDDFAGPLFEFNRLSGEYFSEFQHGPYHSQLSTQIVDDVRSFGIEAVGQSSWGPCIFAIAGNDVHANQLVSYLQTSKPGLYCDGRIEFLITTANNSGAYFCQGQGSGEPFHDPVRMN